MPNKKQPKKKWTLKDVGRFTAPFVGAHPKVSPFDTLKRSTGNLPATLMEGVRRGRLTDKYGEKAVSSAERKALALSYSPDLGKVGTPEYRQKVKALKKLREKINLKKKNNVK